jgi:hypothetical protein
LPSRAIGVIVATRSSTAYSIVSYPYSSVYGAARLALLDERSGLRAHRAFVCSACSPLRASCRPRSRLSQITRLVRASAGECCAILAASSRAQEVGRRHHLADQTDLLRLGRRHRSDPPNSDMRSTTAIGIRRARPTGSSAEQPTCVRVEERRVLGGMIRSLSASAARRRSHPFWP